MRHVASLNKTVVTITSIFFIYLLLLYHQSYYADYKYTYVTINGL